MNYVGKYVVVRARGAGVFAGTLKEKDGNKDAYGGSTIRKVLKRMEESKL